MDPNHSEHASYIKQLCSDFVTSMKSLIENGILERLKSQIDEPLYREIAQHLNQCHSKCKVFTGRIGVLKVSRNNG